MYSYLSRIGLHLTIRHRPSEAYYRKQSDKRSTKYIPVGPTTDKTMSFVDFAHSSDPAVDFMTQDRGVVRNLADIVNQMDPSITPVILFLIRENASSPAAVPGLQYCFSGTNTSFGRMTSFVFYLLYKLMVTHLMVQTTV